MGAPCHLTDLPLETMPDYAAQLVKDVTAKFGKWNSGAISFIPSWYCFLTAVKKADSLDVDDIIAAMQGLQFEAPYGGRAVMFKRPDMGNNRYCDASHNYLWVEVKNGKKVVTGKLTMEECLEGMEKIYGHPGEWR